ncbi:hypothetical protein JCM11491_005244 [Sporobolomyces phaffii]
MSATLSTTATLPTELIDEILRSDVLSNHDLARCCLTSRQFLPAARHSLYDHVRVIFYVARRSGGQGARHVSLSRASNQLFETLKASPALGRRVKSISFLKSVVRFMSRAKKILLTGPTVFISILHVAPNACRVALDEHWARVLQYQVDLRDSRVKEIAVDGLSSSEADKLSIPNQVNRLKLTRMRDPYSRFQLTSQALQALDAGHARSATFFTPQLRILRCLSLSNIDDISGFTALTHLCLVLENVDPYLENKIKLVAPEVLDPSPPLANLRFLSFETGHLSPGDDAAVDSLLSAVPLGHQIVLRFPQRVPFDLLAERFGRTLVPARRIQVSKLAREQDSTKLSQLRRQCLAVGIEFEWVASKSVDIFS